MMNALFEALKRGLDYHRDPGTFSVHPRPPMVGSLTTFAPLASGVLHVANSTPAPNDLVGTGQFGVLPKSQ